MEAAINTNERSRIKDDDQQVMEAAIDTNEMSKIKEDVDDEH